MELIRCLIGCCRTRKRNPRRLIDPVIVLCKKVSIDVRIETQPLDLAAITKEPQ